MSAQVPTCLEEPNGFRDNWVDAQELHNFQPETFDAPSLEEINKIEKGTSVKICNGKERFWVRISGVYSQDKTDFEKEFEGRVANYLLDNSDYDYSDRVIFAAKNIYEILT